MLRKYTLLALLVLGTLLQVSPAREQAWHLDASGLRAGPVPARTSPLTYPDQADFKGDGQLETLNLTNGRARLLIGLAVVWQSPPDWQVSQALISDVIHSGLPQAALLVWRPVRPWPVDKWLPHGGRIQSFHNSRGQSCQLILIGWRRDAFTEIWAGSALADPVLSFAVADLDGSGQEKLVTLEGAYADPRYAPAHDLKVWEWNGFGFSVVDSIQRSFTKMALAKDENGRIWIFGP
jgi:hypothetical protein